MDGILIKVTLFWERKLLRNIKRNICQDYSNLVCVGNLVIAGSPIRINKGSESLQSVSK